MWGVPDLELAIFALERGSRDEALDFDNHHLSNVDLQHMIMATQDAAGIDFSILPAGQQEHFRLLELPPELLGLLTSEDAPV